MDPVQLLRTPTSEKSHLHRVMATTPGGVRSPAVRIPPTPFLKRLGYGTAVDVFLYDRGGQGSSASPWALKRVQQADTKPSVAHRLEHEAAVLKRLNHPNIIGYRGFKTTERGKILMMEDGEISLFDLIEERRDDDIGPYPASNIEAVVLGAARALDYLHTEIGLLHGDLKSGNVLIKNDFDQIKLCDFGVTVSLDENLMAVEGEEYIGTDLWSAPEVLNEEPIGASADIFSLGLIVYEMLALEMPHCYNPDQEITSDDSFTDTKGAQSLLTKCKTDSGLDDSLQSYKDSDADTSQTMDQSVGAPDISDKYGTRPELPMEFDYNETYSKVMQVFFACTEQNPKMRPTAKDIVKLLTS